MTETNRYENGKIYKLVSNHTDKIYIGSTCKERLCQRLAKHKAYYKEWLKNDKRYMSSCELFRLGDVEIVLLENINCKTKDELHKKEREYIEKFKDNERNKKYRIEHKENQKQRRKEHYEKNKQELKQKMKIYNENHIEELKQNGKELYDCKCGKQIQKSSKCIHNKTKFHLEHI